MRLLILSDLHREIWKTSFPAIDPSISKPDAVILAGDIDVGARAVEWAALTFTGISVLYVHGNHEAYGKSLEDMQHEIGTACQATENVHFLNGNELTLNGVRFLGTTMWTDFNLFGDNSRMDAMRASEAALNDYWRIDLAREGNRTLRASDTANFHAQQRQWLQEMLNIPFEGKTVVITHMAPSMLSIADQYAIDLVSAAFASNLDDLVEMADLWVHGHMHNSFDYQIGKCRVVCNPCGYVGYGGKPENDRFDSNYLVEI